MRDEITTIRRTTLRLFGMVVSSSAPSMSTPMSVGVKAPAHLHHSTPRATAAGSCCAVLPGDFSACSCTLIEGNATGPRLPFRFGVECYLRPRHSLLVL
jgi:hypothetical protein